MKDLLELIAHLFTRIAKPLGPGGAQTIIADSLLMKQQPLIINRHRKLGFQSIFRIHCQIQQAAVIITPSASLIFHPLLKQRKYRLLYASARKTKPGPKSPSREIMDAVVELKQHNAQEAVRNVRPLWCLFVSTSKSYLGTSFSIWERIILHCTMAWFCCVTRTSRQFRFQQLSEFRPYSLGK